MEQLNHKVEVIVHVNEGLDKDRRNDISRSLKERGGVYSADFCPSRYHLMLVDYDRNQLSSGDILQHIRNQNIHAQLIGPV